MAAPLTFVVSRGLGEISPPLLEESLQFESIQGVDDVLSAQPPLTADPDTECDVIQVAETVGVRVDGDRNTELSRLLEVAPVEVQAIGMGVQLDGGAAGSGSFEDLIYIDGESISL